MAYVGGREKMGGGTESGKQGGKSSPWLPPESRPGVEVGPMGNPEQAHLATALYSQ